MNPRPKPEGPHSLAAIQSRQGRLMLLALMLCAAALAQPTPPIVPVDKEPHHHLVFENEYVRVFSVELPPHSETLYHQHDRDYLFVTLGDSSVENHRIGAEPAKLELKDGETRFTKGGFAHKAVNLSDKPFKNWTIEIRKPMQDVHASGFTRISGEAGETTWFTSPNVRCLSIFGSKDSSAGFKGEHYLIMPLSKAFLKQEIRKQEQRTELQLGDVAWIAASDQTLWIGSHDGRPVNVCAFKPAAFAHEPQSRRDD